MNTSGSTDSNNGGVTTVTLQAETASLIGAVVDNKNSGAQGGSYADFINATGDSIAWTINAADAGTRSLSFRYALGSTTPRSLALEVNGVVLQNLDFTSTGLGRTGWRNWTDLSVDVNLQQDNNIIRLVAIGDSGPNIDSLTIVGADGGTTDGNTDSGSGEETGDGTDGADNNGDSSNLVTRINFQPNNAPTPSGYIADTGLGYDNRRGYGWVTQNSVGSNNPTALNLTTATRDRNSNGIQQSLDTLIHLQRPGLNAGWEYNLANGDYLVRVALGDPEYFDSRHLLRIEDQIFSPDYTPDAISPFSIVTGVVTVTDGRLSVDADGGDNTKLSYIEIEAIAPEQPTFGSAFDGTSELINGETDISGDASFSFGINAQSASDVIEASSVSTNTVKLIRTADGAPVAGSANTTGGRDSVSFTPATSLEPNTQYTFIIDGVTNEAGAEYVSESRTFTTEGDNSSNDGNNGGTTSPNSFDFDRSKAFDGSLLASLVVSPDGQKLYAATLTGSIRRWDINQTTGALSNAQTFDIGGPDGPRAIIGIEFDPTNPNRLWISHNASIFQPPADNFTGKISYLDLGTGPAFTANVTDYVIGLPRSIRDHLSNSLEFGPDGALYLTQGSNSAQGAPDNAWGNRAENLLTAAVLRIAPNRTPPTNGFNVQTENGGSYNPFASNAPVTLYATGIRNAYDLVWHSNGQLYVPTNSSAAGGNTPDDPSTTVNEGLQNVVIQTDYLYRVEAGGYYGHPNALRGEYVLNGGNPTAGGDLAEIVGEGSRNGYAVGVQPDANYRGFEFDFGFNRSPNGSIEYQSNAFGDRLSGRLLVTEYSGGDQIRSLVLDASGSVVDDEVIATGFSNPLDIIEHTASGRLYVIDDTGITLLTPNEPATSTNLISISTSNAVLATVNSDSVLSGGIAETTTAINVLVGSAESDSFIIENKYSNFGDSDYALIRGFDTANDTIVLGTSSYQLANTPSFLPTGTGIYEGNELTAIVEGFTANQLDISASYFTA